MAVQKGTRPKTTTGKSAPKTVSRKRTTKQPDLRQIETRRQTTRVSQQKFGDSAVDEIILILIIIVSIVAMISFFNSKMGIAGTLLNSVLKGMLGFGAFLLPLAVIGYCAWMLISKERENEGLKLGVIALLLVCTAGLFYSFHPVQSSASIAFSDRCASLYKAGSFQNGGLIGGLVGSVVVKAFDKTGAILIFTALIAVSVIMITDRSFFMKLSAKFVYRKEVYREKKRVRAEKIKNETEKIRQEEIIPIVKSQKSTIHSIKQQKSIERTMEKRKRRKGDFNIVIKECEGKPDITQPVVEATVFRKRERSHIVKIKEKPIYDYIREVKTEDSKTGTKTADDSLSQAPNLFVVEPYTEEDMPIIHASGGFAEDVIPKVNAEELKAEVKAALVGEEVTPIAEENIHRRQRGLFREEKEEENSFEKRRKEQFPEESIHKQEQEKPQVYEDVFLPDIVVEDDDEPYWELQEDSFEDSSENTFESIASAEIFQDSSEKSAVSEEIDRSMTQAQQDYIPVPIAQQENEQPQKPLQQHTQPSAQHRKVPPSAPSALKPLEPIAKMEIKPEQPVMKYKFPPIELLGIDKFVQSQDSKSEMLQNAKKLEETLKSFGIIAKVIQINKGPTVTRYELSPNQGVKVSKIVNLADDIALNLAASGIRIEAPIPGKAAVGIEVPNKEVQSVYLRSVLESEEFKKFPSKLAFALGQDIAGKAVVTDIAKMPHLLIAGATGSGKSVCINTLITSILYKADPAEVKLLLVDPKVVELNIYNGIPHLLIPVVTDPKKAAAALNWAVREMLLRYNDFAENNVRDIKGYNAMKKEKGEEGFMPQIVIIIDELADLMMAAPGEVEDAVCRLAQMARAAGMHLIIATQRPSVDVITGVIKANIPSRLAFAVSSGIDSRTILNMVGAEKLLGKGDMLFYPSGMSKPVRIQGAFVTDKEVESIVSFVKQDKPSTYDQEMIDKITATPTIGDANEDTDEFFEQALDLVVEKEKASVSMLQRQFRIGYNRAARLMDELENRGIVGPEEGSKPRKVLMSQRELVEYRNSDEEM